MTLPTHIQPGLHDGVVAVSVGYGRTKAGKVGNDIGQNAYVFATADAAGNVLFSGAAVEIKKLGKMMEEAHRQSLNSLIILANKKLEIAIRKLEENQ